MVESKESGWLGEKVRLLYWFLLFLFAAGLVLVVVGQHRVLVTGEPDSGGLLTLFGAIILGFLLAVVALLVERWRRRWWERTK